MKGAVNMWTKTKKRFDFSWLSAFWAVFVPWEKMFFLGLFWGAGFCPQKVHFFQQKIHTFPQIVHGPLGYERIL
jgi:hypothetical protein